MHNRNGCNEDQLGIIISRAKQSNDFSSCKGELWVRGKCKKSTGKKKPVNVNKHAKAIKAKAAIPNKTK